MAANLPRRLLIRQAASDRTQDVKVALVAGAMHGCGRAIAVEPARAGAYVYATGRSSSAAGDSADLPADIRESLAEVAGGEAEVLSKYEALRLISGQ